MSKIWNILRGYEEIVDDLPVNRDKEKPWVCYVHTPFWENLFFGPYRTIMFIDTKHFDYINNVLKPRIK